MLVYNLLTPAPRSLLPSQCAAWEICLPMGRIEVISRRPAAGVDDDVSVLDMDKARVEERRLRLKEWEAAPAAARGPRPSSPFVFGGYTRQPTGGALQRPLRCSLFCAHPSSDMRLTPRRARLSSLCS